MLSPAEIGSLRHQLWQAGFHPIPLETAEIGQKDSGKAPKAGNEWQIKPDQPPIWVTQAAKPWSLNTGLVTTGLRVIDFDIDDPDLASRCCQLARDMLPRGAPVRYRDGSPRCAMVWRAAEGEPLKLSIIGKTHDTNGKACKIEVLGRGNQFVAYGQHWQGAVLRWEGELRSLHELPTVDEPTIHALLGACAKVIDADAPRYTNGHGHERQHQTSEPQADIFRIAAALADIPNDGPANWDEVWNYIGMAVWRATGGSEAGFALWDAWSARHPSYDASATRTRWEHYFKSPPDRIGAGTVFHLAAEARAATAAAANAPLGLFDPWAELVAPPLPFDALPPVLREFAEDRARVIGADPCGIVWAAIAACSAAIPGSVRLRMKQHDTWSVPPALWVALIGQSAITMKTPTIDAAWAPLTHAQNTDLAEWQVRLAEWRLLPKKERDATPQPMPRRRLISHDGTMEALQDILGRQDRGIGVLRDELAGWIGQLEKYGSPKSGAADRAFYLQAFNGGPHAVDRITRGTVPINNLLVAICGGIQPERLRQFGDLSDDGLWQRFLPFILQPSALGRDEAVSPAVQRYHAAIEAMLDIRSTTIATFDNAGHEVRAEIEARIFELVQTNALGPRFASFLGKLPGVWGRLCLVLNYLHPPQVPWIVPLETAQRAHTLLLRCVIPHAARVYLATGAAGADIEATRAIAGYILTKHKTRVLISELARDVRAARHRLVADIQALASPLVAGGWLTPETEWNTRAWIVNPAVHAQFANRATTEATRRAAARAIILNEVT